MIYKHKEKHYNEIPFKLSKSEIEFMIRKKMNQGMSYDEAFNIVSFESRCIARSEISRVNSIRNKRVELSKNKPLLFKESFKQLKKGVR